MLYSYSCILDISRVGWVGICQNTSGKPNSWWFYLQGAGNFLFIVYVKGLWMMARWTCDMLWWTQNKESHREEYTGVHCHHHPLAASMHHSGRIPPDNGIDCLVNHVSNESSPWEAREKQLLPLYTSVATTFADLHDRAGRMKAKGVIRESISWKEIGDGMGMGCERWFIMN